MTFLHVLNVFIMRSSLSMAIQCESFHRVNQLFICVSTWQGTPTAPAALRTLRFRLYDDGAKIDHVPPLQLQPLAAVVHRMPQLTTLDIAGAPSDDFLLALDGRAMPNLAELRLNSPIECPHVWAHSEQVRPTAV